MLGITLGLNKLIKLNFSVCNTSLIFCSPCVLWVEPGTGGCSTVSPARRQLSAQNLHQDVWSHGCHDCHRQCDGAASRSASGSAEQLDHGTYTHTHRQANTHTHVHTHWTQPKQTLKTVHCGLVWYCWSLRHDNVLKDLFRITGVVLKWAMSYLTDLLLFVWVSDIWNNSSAFDRNCLSWAGLVATLVTW